MKTAIFILSAVLALASCSTGPQQKVPAASQAATHQASPGLEATYFDIDADRDTVLRGAAGTSLFIRKGSFVQAGGGAISGPVRISLKEALNPVEIVLAGMHTVTGDGKVLQTGGMIDLRASQGQAALRLADGKSVGVVLPAKKLIRDMKQYQGGPDISGHISWNTPSALLHLERKQKPGSDSGLASEYVPQQNESPKQANAPADQVGKRPASGNAVPVNNYFPDFIPGRGSNLFNVDPEASYVFELRRLGWANIDRLYQERNLQRVNLRTIIDHDSSFDRIYITLAMPEQGVYLPGYQKGDGSFGFSHGDEEQMMLPVGAKATVVVTAYRAEALYYAIRPLSISAQTLTLRPEKTTPDAFRSALQAAL